jgi:UrcA family protein
MTTKLTGILPRLFTAAVIGVVALPALGAPAHADTQTGKIRITQDVTVRYQNLDFSNPLDRQALLARVEKEAAKFCDGYMVRADRRDCENRLVINAMKANPETERRALALALVERNTVAQAMR